MDAPSIYHKYSPFIYDTRRQVIAALPHTGAKHNLTTIHDPLEQRYNGNPQPSTRNPTPFPFSSPYPSNPKPYTLHPKP